MSVSCRQQDRNQPQGCEGKGIPALQGVSSPRVGTKGSGAYSPNLPALFSRNKLPSRIYRRTICTLRCPVWFIIDRSEAPAIAALVACPARRECPAYLAASSPARSASFFTTRATSIPDNLPGCTRPCLLIDRNSGP